MRLVLDDNGRTVDGAHDHGAASREGPPEHRFERRQILRRGVVKGQRQNSSVRSSRVTKPLVLDERPAEAGDGVVTRVETDDGETRGWSPGSPVLWDTTPEPLPGRT